MPGRSRQETLDCGEHDRRVGIDRVSARTLPDEFDLGSAARSAGSGWPR